VTMPTCLQALGSESLLCILSSIEQRISVDEFRWIGNELYEGGFALCNLRVARYYYVLTLNLLTGYLLIHSGTFECFCCS
jgi:hypothetical protein